jgi:hypothetical protein
MNKIKLVDGREVTVAATFNEGYSHIVAVDGCYMQVQRMCSEEGAPILYDVAVYLTWEAVQVLRMLPPLKDEANITVRENTVEQGGGFSAWIETIPAVGTGGTRNAAIEVLCSLLGDFVKGHGARIEQLEDKLKRVYDLDALFQRSSALPSEEHLEAVVRLCEEESRP